jgi:hypothetical protein
MAQLPAAAVLGKLSSFFVNHCLINVGIQLAVVAHEGNIGGAADHLGRGTNFLINNEVTLAPDGVSLEVVPLTLARHTIGTTYYRDSRCPQRWTKLYGPTRTDAIHKGVMDVCCEAVKEFLFLEGTPSWMELDFTRGLEEFFRGHIERLLGRRHHLPPLGLSRVRVAQRTAQGVTGLNDTGIMQSNEVGLYFNVKAPLWPSPAANALSWLCYLVLYLKGDWKGMAAEEYTYVFDHMAPLSAPPVAQLRFRTTPLMSDFLHTLPDVRSDQIAFTYNEVRRVGAREGEQLMKGFFRRSCV